MDLTEPITVETLEGLMSGTGVEPVIVEKTKEEPPKTCQIYRPHPSSDEHALCGCKSAYVVTVQRCESCGTRERDVYLCEGCWTRVENGVPWTCHSTVGPGSCPFKQRAKDWIIAWKRL